MLIESPSGKSSQLFHFNKENQAFLESVVQKVLTTAERLREDRGAIKVVREERDGNNHNALDVIAQKVFSEQFGGTVIFSEENSERTNYGLAKRQGALLVVDPIDGSSRGVANGWGNSPLCTTVMLLAPKPSCNNYRGYEEDGEKVDENRFGGWVITAAAACGINSRVIYGLREGGVARYRYGNKFKEELLNLKEKTLCGDENPKPPLIPAAFSVSSRPGRRAIALLTSYQQGRGRITKPTNDGGGLYPFVVAGGGEHRYTVAAEPLPVPLYELITGFMAMKAGAVVTRMDGTPLTLDPEIKQTMVVARTEELAEDYRQIMKPLYKVGFSNLLLRVLVPGFKRASHVVMTE